MSVFGRKKWKPPRFFAGHRYIWCQSAVSVLCVIRLLANDPGGISTGLRQETLQRRRWRTLRRIWRALLFEFLVKHIIEFFLANPDRNVVTTAK